MSENHDISEPTTQEYVIKNRLRTNDETIHNWYRFVLGYPPHLVREYLDLLGADASRDWIFDPFCGTATTPVEARLQGFATISADANPIALLATRVKLNWDIDTEIIRSLLPNILELSIECIRKYGLDTLPDGYHQLSLFSQINANGSDNFGSLPSHFNADVLLPGTARALIPEGFISPKPLLRTLALRYAIETLTDGFGIRDFFLLALANVIVKPAGNVAFGPEVYRLPPKDDADVLGAFESTVDRMVSDVITITSLLQRPYPPAAYFLDDARTLSGLDELPPVGIVITSPPYPNEKDYTRSTRLESVLLSLISTKGDLRSLKDRLLRSNTRNVFYDDSDDSLVADIPSISNVANEIEDMRVKLGKTSGFERLYHRVTRLYFGGMYRHLSVLRPRLLPGARCAYVVGDQMSYFRIHIQTAKLLAEVAIKAGYLVEGIQLWRTRRSTATGIDLEENVLILKKPK